jgi:hypothetical protein
MYTYYNDERVYKLVAKSYEARKVTAVLCHSTPKIEPTRTSVHIKPKNMEVPEQ